MEGGEHVVVGFRAAGDASIYFGGDTAYHFNSRGQLRRAYRDGLLYRAEQGRLVSLERIRQENEVQLLRRPLFDAEQATFLATMHERLRKLANQCGQHVLVPIGQVPVEADVLGRARDWLELAQAVTVAKSPYAR
jgi:hypothetical protein